MREQCLCQQRPMNCARVTSGTTQRSSKNAEKTAKSPFIAAITAINGNPMHNAEPVFEMSFLLSCCKQSCLSSKNHGDHKETHGKEELTKCVVLKHMKVVVTLSVREATCRNFSNSVKVTSQARKKGIACDSSDVLCCQLPPPSLSLLLSSYHLSHTRHPCPHNPTPTPLLPPSSPPSYTPRHHHHTPPTPAVHTLRPPRNVGPGCTSTQLRYSPITAFGAITTFTKR